MLSLQKVRQNAFYIHGTLLMFGGSEMETKQDYIKEAIQIKRDAVKPIINKHCPFTNDSCRSDCIFYKYYDVLQQHSCRIADFIDMYQDNSAL